MRPAPVPATGVPPCPSRPVRPRAPARLDSLTGLRFFAALAVFAWHFAYYAKLPLLPPQSQFGGHAVTFFFVLSGFVLTWTWRPADSARQFYRRRFARIYPLHVVATALAVAVFYFYSGTRPDWTWITASLLLVQTWFPDVSPTYPGNPVSWTLSVEAFFYAAFPFLITALHRLRTRWLPVLCGGLALAAVGVTFLAAAVLDPRDASWFERHPVFRVWQFVLGILLALAVRRRVWIPGRLWMPLLLLVGWRLVEVDVRSHLVDPSAVSVLPLQQAIVPLLSGWIIALAAQADLTGRRSLLRHRALVLLGAWSFAFYLVHYSVIRFAMTTWGQRPASNANLFDMLGMALVAVGLSALLFSTIERPCERWMRALLGRGDPHRGSSSGARDEAVLGARAGGGAPQRVMVGTGPRPEPPLRATVPGAGGSPVNSGVSGRRSGRQGRPVPGGARDD